MLKKMICLLLSVVFSCGILSAATVKPVTEALNHSEEFLKVLLKTGYLSAAEKQSVVSLIGKLEAESGFGLSLNSDGSCVFYAADKFFAQSSVEYSIDDTDFYQEIRNTLYKCRDLYLSPELKKKPVLEGEIYAGTDNGSRPVYYVLFFCFYDGEQCTITVDKNGQVQPFGK